MDLIIEKLNPTFHDRNSFECGVNALDVFFKQHANQNQAKNISQTFVAVAESADLPKKVHGYYTLSAGELRWDSLPEASKVMLPKYPLPIVRVARLAVNKADQGKGVGGKLLYDAFSQVLRISKELGVYAMVVDAKDEHAKAFYLRYGFIVLQDSELTLFISLKTLSSVSI